MPNPPSRPVYDSSSGRLCPSCGQPIGNCQCKSREDEPLPPRISCVLRLESKGRAGKTVTVVAGLPRNQAFLAQLAGDLRRRCGAGGTVADGSVLLQGDRRERLRDLLKARGFLVRG